MLRSQLEMQMVVPDPHPIKGVRYNPDEHRWELELDSLDLLRRVVGPVPFEVRFAQGPGQDLPVLLVDDLSRCS